jgi:hypothetical protein
MNFWVIYASIGFVFLMFGLAFISYEEDGHVDEGDIGIAAFFSAVWPLVLTYGIFSFVLHIPIWIGGHLKERRNEQVREKQRQRSDS